MRKKFDLILLIVFTISCMDLNPIDNSNIKQDISISLILVYPQRRQTATITYLHAKEEFGMAPIFVDSAVLKVNNTNFRNTLNDSLKLNRFCLENPINLKKCYNYYTDNLLIKSGEKYKLTFKYKNITISGETIVPDVFKIFITGRRIFWTKNENACLFRITITQKENNIVYEGTTEKYTMELDNEKFSKGNYKIKIEAIDKNFYDFITNNEVHSGMNNGFGIFGSVTIMKKEFTL